MRALIQRVQSASVEVDDNIVGSIEEGLLVFLGITEGDGSTEIDWLVRKITNLRIFNDSDQVMNKSVKDVSGSVLVISQFTLHASTRKGNRPSYIKAAKPGISEPLYEEFVKEINKHMDSEVQTGIFGADMKVELVNDGPVTIIIDTELKE